MRGASVGPGRPVQVRRSEIQSATQGTENKVGAGHFAGRRPLPRNPDATLSWERTPGREPPEETTEDTQAPEEWFGLGVIRVFGGLPVLVRKRTAQTGTGSRAGARSRKAVPSGRCGSDGPVAEMQGSLPQEPAGLRSAPRFNSHKSKDRHQKKGAPRCALLVWRRPCLSARDARRPGRGRGRAPALHRRPRGPRPR